MKKPVGNDVVEHFIKNYYGKTSISGIGDGTATGAISYLNGRASALTTKTNTLETNLNTLSSNTTINISNTSHNLVNPIDFFNGKKMLLIGDSYCINVNTNPTPGWTDGNGFGKLMCSYYNMTLNNYSVAGIGFGNYNTSVNYLSQLQKAISAISDKDNYALVLFAGGANDGDQSSSVIYDRIKQCYTLAKTNFKKAKIYTAFIGWSRNGGTFSYFNRARRYWTDACALTGMPMLHGTEWALHHWDRVGSDNLHPSADGQKWITRYIMSALNNGGTCVYHEYYENKKFTTIENGASVINGGQSGADGNNYGDDGFRCVMNNGTCTISIKQTYFQYSSVKKMKMDGHSMYQVAAIHSFMNGGKTHQLDDEVTQWKAHCPTWLAFANVGLKDYTCNYLYLPVRLTVSDGNLWITCFKGDGGNYETLQVVDITLFPTSFTCSLDMC